MLMLQKLVRFFKTKFYLSRKLNSNDLKEKLNKLKKAIVSELDTVQILMKANFRLFLTVINDSKN